MKQGIQMVGAALLVILSGTLAAEDWIKTLKDRSERGALSDRRQKIRGDSGKWNDAPKLVHAPPIEKKPARELLDEWAAQIAEKPVLQTAGDDNWLIFQTRQLDDNDRVWIEKIDRVGNRFTVVLSQAVWQGNYSKNFTYFEVVAVNLGKLEPGDYEAKWIVKPLEYLQVEDPANRRASWPKDEKPAKEEPVELQVVFRVAGAPQPR